MTHEHQESSAVHITLGTSPSGGFSLESEMRLLKPALLYGDHVTLISPKATMLAMAAGISELDESDRIEFLRQVLPVAEPNQADQIHAVLDAYAALRKKKNRSRDEIVIVERMRKQLETTWINLRSKMEDLLTTAGADELTPAIEVGLLEIDPIARGEDFSVEIWMEEFINALAATLGAGHTYPLFDDATGSLVKAHVAGGLIEPTGMSKARGKQVTAASGLMSRLPAFSEASVLEVLDIRRELATPLVRFRSGMVQMARTMEQPFYEEDFQEEVDQVFVELIAPALAEITDAVEANSYLKRLLGNVVSDMKTLVTGVLTIGLTRAADLPPLIAAGATAATVAAKSAWERSQETKRIAAHQFYFLYRTEALLSKERE